MMIAILSYELFVAMILSWNSLKCILFTWIFGSYETSVSTILIDKNFQQVIYFWLLEMGPIFFKEGKSNFCDYTWIEITEIISSTSCKIFPFILFEKRRLTEGIRRPKAADSPLILSNFVNLHLYFLRKKY